MKRILFIATMILVPFLDGYSQDFVSKDNKWIIKHRTFPFQGVIPIQYSIYWFKDEVIIDGDEFLSLCIAALGDPEFKSTQTFYRELGPGVFVFDMETNDESLLYDFELQEGFPFALTNHPNTTILGTVEEIRNFPLLDGTTVSAMEVELDRGFNLSTIEDVFVDGIGSLTYPFKPGSQHIDYWESIACFLRNDTLLYSQDEDLSFCAQFGTVPTLSSVNSEIQYEQVSVFSKTGRIYCSGIEGNNLTLSLFDLTGQKVCELKSTINSSFELPVTPAGLYVCVLQSENQFIHTQRLFIN